MRKRSSTGCFRRVPYRFAPHSVERAKFRIEVSVGIESLAGMSPSDGKPALRPPTPLHIARAAGPAIDLTTTEYSVTIGGSKDAVGTVLLGSPAGLDALTAFLHKIGLASSEIENARRVLSEQSDYELPDVTVSPTILRQLGELRTPR
jgi:hypothetical protein